MSIGIQRNNMNLEIENKSSFTIHEKKLKEFISIIYQAIAHTPWWVWILFGILLFRGIAALKPSTIPLSNIFIAPF